MILYVGIDWSETRRCPGIEAGWAPWPVRFPMCEPPHLTKPEMLALTRSHGIEPPRMYAQGFSHANCGGACVRGGQAHWRRLLHVNPDLFAQWEAFEAEMRARHDDVAILRRQRGGIRTPYTLAELRSDAARTQADVDGHDPASTLRITAPAYRARRKEPNARHEDALPGALPVR